jgi:FkbM family methyltransferase
MQAGLLFKYGYIKICRYIFKKKYLPIMAGPLKGYLWPTERSYEYIIGNNEPEEVMNEFCSWFSAGSVFYDIGSNIGFYSLIANRLILSGKIYAIEPTTFNNNLFKQLLVLNKKKMPCNNIELLAFAVSDTEKEVDFSNNTIFAEGNTYVLREINFKSDTVKVKCYSIDRLLQMGYSAPGIMKIDIEGAEYDALIGATDTIKKYTPNIFLATHNCIVPGIREKCVQYLEELGYVLKHTGYHNKSMAGLDDYLAVHKHRIKRLQ